MPLRESPSPAMLKQGPSLNSLNFVENDVWLGSVPMVVNAISFDL
jgi:hypothetical protein